MLRDDSHSLTQFTDSSILLPSEVVPSVRRHRSPFKAAMHLIRRGHLYFGLFLFPWAILYGVTAYLFNHPSAFSDQPAVGFGRESMSGTPMESLQSPGEIANLVVAGLNERAKEGDSYTLVEGEKPHYTRDFVFATIKQDEQTINLLFDVNGQGGTIRGQPVRVAPKPIEKAPFAIGTSAQGGGQGRAPKGGVAPKKGPRPTEGSNGPPLLLPDSLAEKAKAAIPTVLERNGYAPTGDIAITSVPDLSFVLVDANGKNWIATYNSQTGSVAGKPQQTESTGEGISTRRFLTRLHVAHGYPASGGPRWYWALIVDAMAFIMVFWGLSGLLMWWQIKATRRLGILMILLSAGIATWLAIGMHGAMTG